MSTNDAGLSDEVVVELTPAEADPQPPAEDGEPVESEGRD